MRFNVGVASDDEVSKVELDSEAEKFAATIGPMKNLSIKRENQSLKFLMTNKPSGSLSQIISKSMMSTFLHPKSQK